MDPLFDVVSLLFSVIEKEKYFNIFLEEDFYVSFLDL